MGAGAAWVDNTEDRENEKLCYDRRLISRLAGRLAGPP